LYLRLANILHFFEATTFIFNASEQPTFFLEQPLLHLRLANILHFFGAITFTFKASKHPTFFGATTLYLTLANNLHFL